MSHTPEELKALSGLLDEALELTEGEREGWLERLRGESARFVPVLRVLLERYASRETDELLGGASRLAGLADAGAGDLFGPYRLLSSVGSGGMGEVWLAERADGAIDRRVALKLPHAAWAPGLAERFSRERQILATLEHPHIARLYDAGVDGVGRPYMAMEYVEGQAIDAYCTDHDLDVQARLGLLLQVANAVAFAHSRLVVHRDLKPGNILVTADGQVRLLDFGIAKLLHGDGSAKETALTRAAGRALTLDYASPEQIRGEPIGTASDVYSLAVVAYELLAGVRPYRLERRSAAALEEAIANAEVPLASSQAQDPSLRRRLRGDLDAILNQALKKDPSRRYATVDALAQDWRRYLEGNRVLARPDTIAYRARRLFRRYRVPLAVSALVTAAFTLAIGFGATALVIGTLLVGLAASAWQARRARKQANIARTEARTAQAVQDFLEGIFRANSGDQADPLKARQRTAKELLDLGATRIQRDLDEAPGAKVRVLKVLAQMYEDMVELDRSVALDDLRIVAARRLGAESSEELHARADRASRLIHLGRADEAFAELERGRLLLESRVGHDIDARIAYHMWRGRYYQYRRNPALGLQSTERALHLLRQKAATDFFVAALECHAALLNQESRSAEALAAANEGLAVIAAHPGMAESVRPELHLRAAQAYARLDDFPAAERAFEAATADYDAAAGSTSASAAYVRAWHGRVLIEVGRVRTAASVYRDAASIILACAQQRQFFLSFLGEAIGAYRRVGWLAEAVPLGTAAESMSPERSEHRQSAALFLINFGSIAIERGELVEAAQRLRRAKSLIDEHGLHADTVYRDDYVTAIVRLHAVEGSGARAMQVLTERGDSGIADNDYVGLRATAIALLANQDPMAAAQRCETALAAMQPNAGKGAFAEAEAEFFLLLGRAHLLMDDPHAAMTFLRRAEAGHRELYDESRSQWLASVRVQLGHALVAVGETSEASKMLHSAKAIFARHDQVGSQYTSPLQALSSALANDPENAGATGSRG